MPLSVDGQGGNSDDNKLRQQLKAESRSQQARMNNINCPRRAGYAYGQHAVALGPRPRAKGAGEYVQVRVRLHLTPHQSPHPAIWKTRGRHDTTRHDAHVVWVGARKQVGVSSRVHRIRLPVAANQLVNTVLADCISVLYVARDSFNSTYLVCAMYGRVSPFSLMHHLAYVANLELFLFCQADFTLRK